MAAQRCFSRRLTNKTREGSSPHGRDPTLGGSGSRAVASRGGGRVEPGPAQAGRAQTSNGTLALDRMRQPRKLPHPNTSAAEASMPAYFVAENEITNQAGMEP